MVRVWEAVGNAVQAATLRMTPNVAVVLEVVEMTETRVRKLRQATIKVVAQYGARIGVASLVLATATV